MSKSLNPFEIRAGLGALNTPDKKPIGCLNPFEIRAGLGDKHVTTLLRRVMS